MQCANISLREQAQTILTNAASLDSTAVRRSLNQAFTANELRESLREHAPALAYAESQVANVRVRNQGTLGGNLAFNDPHSDPGTVLLIHNASVAIGNQNGEFRIVRN